MLDFTRPLDGPEIEIKEGFVNWKRLVSSSLLLAAVATPNSWAAQPAENLCLMALAKASDNFSHCLAGVNLRPSDGTTSRRRYARCILKYAAVWPKLQMFTGTECEGPRLENNLDGTVTDHLTGLTWEIKGNADEVANLADPHDADNRYAHTDAADLDLLDDDGTAYTDFLATLNASPGFAGSSSWRIPTRFELASIITPVPNGNDWAASLDPVFGPLPSGAFYYYTSASGFPAQPENQLSVSFAPDYLGEANGARDIPFHARAVRGGDW